MEKGIMPWQKLSLGAALLEPGNTRSNRTGDWDSSIPMVDESLCIQCSLCWLLCPEMAYIEDSQGYFRADPFYCKGCGICARECTKGAITMATKEAYKEKEP